MEKRVFLFAIIAVFFILAGYGAWKYIAQRPTALPEAQPYSAAHERIQSSDKDKNAEPTDLRWPAASSREPFTSPPSSSAVLEEVNLAVPFTVQAPNANWDEIHEEFCEEASVLMAASFIGGETIGSPEDADSKMFAIKNFEEVRFGYYKDTTAEETAIILKEYFGIDAVSVVYDPTVAAIKEAVAQGKAVVVPAAGRQLGNPYFTQPGPLYHMLVVKGYAKDGRFITNDPGTRRGANYIYDPQVLLDAVHDWNGGDVENGRKVMIVVG